MKQRILLIVAMLLIASPAMAAVTLTATYEGSGVVRVDYSDTGTNGTTKVRAFALDVSINAGEFSDVTNFKRGESNNAVPGYGIFPGKFRDQINPSDVNWQAGGYNPVCPNSFADANVPPSGLGTQRIIVEMGSLYPGGPSDGNQPLAAGTLFKVKVSAGCTMHFAKNDLRGNVQEDGAAAAVTVPVDTVVPPLGNNLPNVVGLDRVTARNNIIAAGFLDINEYNVPGNGEAMRQVVAQNPAPGLYDPATKVDFNAVSWPIRETYTLLPGPMWANWHNRGRPRCWAYPRQCRGDADGKKLGTFVSSPDLAILRSAVGKLDSAIPPTPTDPNLGICADFTHSKLGTWVSAPDLTILRAYVGKLDSAVPICGNTKRSSPSQDPNYWYWCLPTGGTCPTTPAGQYCAPAGVCPNDP